MWTVNGLLGFRPTGWPQLVNSRVPFSRPTLNNDPRLNPETGGGRRMRHPYLDDIVYPRTPDRTANFDWDVIRRAPAVMTKTAGGTAVAQYPEFGDDVVITEAWDARDLSTIVDLYRLFMEYLTSTLPVGQFIGWTPADRCPYHYFIELLDVRLGQGEEHVVEELGSKEPYMMRETLQVQFKLVQEASAPAGSMVFVGL